MTGREAVARLKKRMDTTLTRAPVSSADIEVQADFAKYFCVLTSGFLENAIIVLILSFAQKRSAPEIQSFIEGKLKYWTNPNVEKVCQLLASFNPDWRIKAGEFLLDERKDAVNSLVALRHQIAHGESVGTSLDQAKAYYKNILVVIDFIADLVDPK